MNSDRPLPVPGEIIAGKYRVEHVIGTGGMGVVVAAHHLQLDQIVALKFLQREALGSKDAVNRFLREGQVLARLKSPHVARVMDVGTLDHGEPYLVMEYLHGADLGSVLKERGQLPVPEAVGYLLQACEAVAEAHANGIVHRDLKPSNLFLTHGSDGLPLVKVLDFGIAKAITRPGAEGDAVVTTTGALVGSPLYMSPEQIRNPRLVDARTDIWSLGVILYELLSGITPFDGETSSGALAAIVADAPTPIRSLRPDLPEELEATVKGCLEKDADARIGSILELARSLESFVTAESRGSILRIARVLGVAVPQAPISSRSAERDTKADEGKSATVPTWEGAARPPPRSRRWVFVSAVTALLATVGFLAFLRSPGPVPPTGTARTGPSVPEPIAPTSALVPALPSVVVTPAPVVAPTPSASASANVPVAESPSSVAVPPSKHKHLSLGKPETPRKHVTEETDDGTSDRQ